MSTAYELSGDLSALADAIGQSLKEQYDSTVLVDRTAFVGGESCCKVDTYQVYDIAQRGFVTINLYFFRPRIAGEGFQVKLSLFTPAWGDDSGLTGRLKEKIGAVISAYGGVEVKEQ